MIHKLGRYESPCQPPIRIVNNADAGDGMHGPWITWRFDWEYPAEDVKTIWYIFDAMIIEGKYEHVEEEEATI